MKEEIKALIRELFARDLDDDISGPSTGTREALIEEYTDKIIAKVRQVDTINGVYRDAGTGRFVTKEQAKASPGTTVLEKIKRFVKG